MIETARDCRRASSRAEFHHRADKFGIAKKLLDATKHQSLTIRTRRPMRALSLDACLTPPIYSLPMRMRAGFGSCARVHRGICCPMTFRPGRWSTSKHIAGFRRAVSRPWSMFWFDHPGRSGAPWSTQRIHSRRAYPAVDLREWTGAPFTTATNANATARSTWRLIPRGSCLLCMRCRPTNRSARRSGNWRDRFGRPRARRSRGRADQGYTGEGTAQAALDEGIELQVIKLAEAKKGTVLLPHRWVVERSFGWLNRFRGLARDDERLPETLAGLHFVIFAVLMLVLFGTLTKSPFHSLAALIHRRQQVVWSTTVSNLTNSVKRGNLCATCCVVWRRKLARHPWVGSDSK